MKRHRLIFSDYVTKQGLVVTYLDVGARGDIAEPWNEFAPNALKVIGFEPDPVEAERLSTRFPNRTYLPFALWRNEEDRPLFLNEWASTSSLLPPNDPILQQFSEQHWNGRKPIREVQVRCAPIDLILNVGDVPDFIKLDTQGAEFEILRGAENLLSQAAPIILAETWCEEVYRGVSMTHEVMAYLYQFGYRLFDIGVAAAWRYRGLERFRCKRRLIGLDVLFVKDASYLTNLAKEQLIKLIGLVELFGFRDYAMHLVNQLRSQLGEKDAMLIENSLRANERGESSFHERLTRKIISLLSRRNRKYPPLH